MEGRLNPKRRYGSDHQRCLTHEFYGKYSRTVYVTHPLPPLDPDAKERSLRRRRHGVQRDFFYWHADLERKRKKQARANLEDDFGFARTWFQLVQEFPLEFPPPHRSRHDSVAKKVCEECAEWVAASLRMAILKERAGRYGSEEAKWARKIRVREGFAPRGDETERGHRHLQSDAHPDPGAHGAEGQSALRVAEGLLRGRRHHRRAPSLPLLADQRLLRRTGPNVSGRRPRLGTVDARLIPLLATSEQQQRQVETALQQECTKIAFDAIRLYVDTIKREIGLVKVECRIVGNKLAIPVERIAEDIKAPILEACGSDRVVLTSDAVDELLEECALFVEAQLDVDDLSRLPLVTQFNRLVFHGKLPASMHDAQLLDFVRSSRQYLFRLQRVPKMISRAVFVVDMAPVWDTLRERASRIIEECSERIAGHLKGKLRDIYEDFFRFGKIVNFRSMDPVAMLSNRAQVMKLSKEFLPKAVTGLLRAIDKMLVFAQAIQFDSSDYELVIEVAALRVAVPRQLADHAAFFERRAHVFKQFVRSRAAGVEKQIQEITERLKKTLVFFDPKAAAGYLDEVRTLRPDVQKTADLVATLNQFEEVLGMPKTDDGDVCRQARSLAEMETLFEWTTRFYDLQREFLESSRRGANVVQGRSFVEQFAEVLRAASERIEKLKPLRHFLVQVSAEVDALREKFDIVEVVGHEALMERHWRKMSDVCGFEMAQFASATVAQICELRLERFLGALKQIAYSAEREAAVLEQIQNIYAFWEEATFVMEKNDDLWAIRFPTNLDSLRRKARVHAERMRGFEEPIDTVMADVRTNMRRWIGLLEELHGLLAEWSRLLGRWLRFAPLLEGGAEGALREEFAEFRKCAKQWRLFDRVVEKQPVVMRIVEQKHASCWLRSVSGHLDAMLQGIEAFFEAVKRRNPRLCLLSDGDLLKILSKTSLERRLEVLRRECFPLTRELRLSASDSLEVVTFDGELVELPEVPRESLEDGDVVRVLQKVERAVDAHLNKELEALIESQDLSAASRLLQNLYECCVPGGGDAPLVYRQKVGLTTLDALYIVAGPPRPLLPEELYRLRAPPPRLLRQLLSSASGRRLRQEVGVVSGAREPRLRAGQSTPCQADDARPFLLRPLRQLPPAPTEEGTVSLEDPSLTTPGDGPCGRGRAPKLGPLRAGERGPALARPFPRLLLHSMTRGVLEDTETEKTTFLAEALGGSESERSGNRITISPSGLDVSTGSTPGTRRSSMRRRRSTLKQKSFAESVLQLFIEGARSFPCVACVGAVSKTTLAEAMDASGAVVGRLCPIHTLLLLQLTWVYFDAFTQNQIVAADTEFAAGTGGFLLRTLKASTRPEASPAPSERSTERRFSLGPLRYVVFHGHRRFFEHFSFVGSLFCSEGADSFPYAFMTLPDGSNFYAAPNVRFVLCVPESDVSPKKAPFDSSFQALITEWLSRFDIRTISLETRPEKSLQERWTDFRGSLRALLKDPDFEKVVVDCFEKILLPLFDSVPKSPLAEVPLFFALCKEGLLEALPFAFPSNCFELFRSKLCATVVNWLVLFADDAVVNAEATALVAEADRGAAYSAKLPDRPSEWKLSRMDFGRWVRWTDEPTVFSNTKKDLPLGEVFLGRLPRLRPLLALRPLASRHDAEEVPRDAPRSESEASLGESKKETRDELLQVLIIEDVRFDDALTPLLEMFLDQSLVMERGTPVRWKTNVQLILVMETTEFERSRRRELFAGNVAVVPVKPTTDTDAILVLEQLFEWNLAVKTFSSEYQTILGPMADASVRLIRKLEMDLWPTMVRLAKGFMFAFSVNVPDVVSMIRLWAHEVLRVMVDPLGSRRRREALEALRTELVSTLDTSVDALFEFLGDRRLDGGETPHNGGTVAEETERLGALLYSELLTADSIDGLGYYAVGDRSALNRAVENVIYESSRSHGDARLDVAVTDVVSDHCQRLMRVLRQSAEHAAVVGGRGVSRSVCLDVAAAGAFGQLLHAHWDFGSAEAAEASWKATIVEALPLLARSNHPLMVVVKLDSQDAPTQGIEHCVATLRRWLQRASLEELLSDLAVLGLGPTILESEKQLTAAMQSSGLRLPGQRLSSLLPLDALKDVAVLRRSLSARLLDLLHFVFVADLPLVPLFRWCTIDYYPTMSCATLKEMLAKILSEAEVEDRDRVERLLRELHSRAQKVLRVRRDAAALQLFALFTRTFNRKKQLRAFASPRLSDLLQIPGEPTTAPGGLLPHSLRGRSSGHARRTSELQGARASTRPGRRGASRVEEGAERDRRQARTLRFEDRHRGGDAAGLGEGARPEREEGGRRLEGPDEGVLLGDVAGDQALRRAAQEVRDAGEALARRQVLRGGERNTLETWTQSTPLLRGSELLDRISEFAVESVSPETLKKLKRYTENREFRVPKLEPESPVAAHLCEWLFATIALVNARESVREASEAVTHLRKEIGEKTVHFDFFRSERKRLLELKARLEDTIARMDERVDNTRRVLDYRNRSARIAEALKEVIERWRREEHEAEKQQETLTGNCALLAVAHVFCLSENFERSLKVGVECKAALREAAFPYEDRVSRRSFYLLDYFRSTSIHRRWPLVAIQDPRLSLSRAVNLLFRSCATISWKSASVNGAITTALKTGSTLVVEDFDGVVPRALLPVLLREVVFENDQATMKTPLGISAPVHEGFRLFFETNLTPVDISSSALEALQLVVLSSRDDLPVDEEGAKETFVEEAERPGNVFLLKTLSECAATEILGSADISEHLCAQAKALQEGIPGGASE
uniref:DHC_N2 domain-containing protein n=1 Tax=Steinernema glaseri TaxID=37863 RepID=A0A1I7YBS6_9BILA